LSAASFFDTNVRSTSIAPHFLSGSRNNPQSSGGDQGEKLSTNYPRGKAATTSRRSILVIDIAGGALSILPIDRENVSLLLYYYKKSANLPLVARLCLFHSRSISAS
jgi:hypothetical protein